MFTIIIKSPLSKLILHSVNRNLKKSLSTSTMSDVSKDSWLERSKKIGKYF